MKPAGFEHHRVAHRQRGRDLPREHQHREVPRDDLPDDADRFVAAQFGGHDLRPARVIIKMAGDERDVNIARLADRLAVVHCFEDGEQARMFLDLTGDGVQITRPCMTRQLAPASEGFSRRLDRVLHIVFAGFGYIRQFLLGRRVDGRIPFLRGRVAPFVVDKKLELAVVRGNPIQSRFRGFGSGSVGEGVENLGDCHFIFLFALSQIQNQLMYIVYEEFRFVIFGNIFINLNLLFKWYFFFENQASNFYNKIK